MTESRGASGTDLRYLYGWSGPAWPTATGYAMTEGLVFDIQRFAPHDGPGIRTTVFLKGCPLHCAWCHNPESRDPGPELLLRAGRCVVCGSCIEVCPETAAVPAGEAHGAPTACVRCGSCVEACPTGAREQAGRTMDAAAVVAEVVRDRVFYEESGGGVTFSGGEPLSQPRFLIECLDACRETELHTAVDTCGHAAPEVVLEVAGRTDLVLFDVKMADPERHLRWTGVDNRLIFANLEMLASRHPEVWLRVPVVPGVNDDPDNIEATAKLAARLEGVRRVCLLPYHRAGTAKSVASTAAGASDGLRPPDPFKLRDFALRLEAHGLTATIGG